MVKHTLLWGPADQGKPTVARTLEPNCCLADDMSLVRINAGNPYAYKTPYQEDGKNSVRQSFPEIVVYTR